MDREEVKITFKLDIERLLQQNDRKVLLKIIPDEVVRYETHQKRYA